MRTFGRPVNAAKSRKQTGHRWHTHILCVVVDDPNEGDNATLTRRELFPRPHVQIWDGEKFVGLTIGRGNNHAPPGRHGVEHALANHTTTRPWGRSPLYMVKTSRSNFADDITAAKRSLRDLPVTLVVFGAKVPGAFYGPLPSDDVATSINLLVSSV